MANKKYTLYYKGKNIYKHEFDIPIISLELRQMDEYTSNFNNYIKLFESFPCELKKFIENNFSEYINLNEENDLKNSLYITDNDFMPIMDVIFKNDLDVLFIEPEELEELIIREKMSYEEYRNISLGTKRTNKLLKKYEFFKYMYDYYIKDKKMEYMIDAYEASRFFPELCEEELLVAALATSKDNIKVLIKKIYQNIEPRRNLAFLYKQYHNQKIINNNIFVSRKNDDFNINDINEQILKNLNEFEKKYKKEYIM